MASKISLDLPGGLKLPVLGIGTWQAKDESELTIALNAALEAGYRHIDTAYSYENERIIAAVLKQWFSAGKLKREDLFITTKLPMHGLHPDRVDFFMKKSLENLQLDYVDLYLIHFPLGFEYDESTGRPKLDAENHMIIQPKTDHAAIWKKMEEQVVTGRTKAIGLSNYNLSQIQTVLKSARIKPACVQVEVHVYLQQRELVDFCKKSGITVIAYSPLASPGYNTFLKNVGKEAKELPNILGDAVIGKLAKKYSKTPAQIALRFLVQRGVAPIPKSVTLKRLKENIDVFDFTLNDNDMEELSGLEMGEKARVLDFKLIPGAQKHPDFPY